MAVAHGVGAGTAIGIGNGVSIRGSGGTGTAGTDNRPDTLAVIALVACGLNTRIDVSNVPVAVGTNVWADTVLTLRHGHTGCAVYIMDVYHNAIGGLGGLNDGRNTVLAGRGIGDENFLCAVDIRNIDINAIIGFFYLDGWRIAAIATRTSANSS